MTRRLLNLLTGLSVLLCLTSLAMWVRSRFVTEVWLFPTRYEPAAPGSLPRGEGSFASAYGMSRAHRVTVPWVAEVTCSPEQRVRTQPPPSQAFVCYGRHWCASVSWCLPAVAA